MDLWDESRTVPIRTFQWGVDSIHNVRFNPVEVCAEVYVKIIIVSCFAIFALSSNLACAHVQRYASVAETHSRGLCI